jgi:hypothetical protein
VIDARTLVNAFRRFVSCTLDVPLGDVADLQFVIPDLGNPTEVHEVNLPQS